MANDLEALKQLSVRVRVSEDGALAFDKADTISLVTAVLEAVRDGAPVSDEWAARAAAVRAFTRKATDPAIYVTGLLARALSPAANVKSIKARSGAGGYSANDLYRLLASALAGQTELPGKAVVLGPSGVAPFNNNPWVDKPAFVPDPRGVADVDYTTLDAFLDAIAAGSVEDAREGLVAFIRACVVDIEFHAHSERESEFVGQRRSAVIRAVDELLDEDPEGGRRCQALLAAALATAFGDGVLSGGINDPSFKLPGDVQVMDGGEPTLVAEAKHRDDVDEAEVRNFIAKLATRNYSRAIYFALGPGNDHLRTLEASLATEHETVTKIITSAGELLDQCFLWCSPLMAARFTDRFVRLYRIWLVRQGAKATARKWEILVQGALDEVTSDQPTSDHSAGSGG